MKHSSQAAEKLKALNPDVRSNLRRALRDVEEGKKRDTKALKNELEGFHRLRVGRWRAIYHFDPKDGTLLVDYIDSREVVYTNFK
jgi:mRNA interferase RelE/StbE